MTVRQHSLAPLAFPVSLVGILSCAAAPHVVPLEITPRTRALAPGELVRIDVRSSEELGSLSCKFLDRPVFMLRDGDATQWTGWAMIDLRHEPGPAIIEVQGTTAGGGDARGTRAVTIEMKDFPEEHLTVASKFVSPPKEVEQRLEKERALLAEVYRTRSELQPASEPFLRPVPGEQSSVFGTRRFFNGVPRSPHPGLDLRGDAGTPVRASGPGKVVLAQDLYYSGNVIILDHGGGLFTLYAHLSRIDVEVGDEVQPGDIVGLVGATGRVTGPHLHWGAKIGSRPFDPSALLDPSLFE